MAGKLTDIKAATEILGAPVEHGLWLSRFRPRWFDGFSTGTELDLLLVLLLLPFLFWHWAFSGKSGRHKETGPVFAAVSADDLILFSGRDGVFRRRIESIELKQPISDVTRIIYNNSNQTSVRFRFTESPDVLLYYHGSRQDLMELVSRAT